MSFNMFLIVTSMLCLLNSTILFYVGDMLSAILFAVFGALLASFLDKDRKL